jgi:hypothetical protein
MRKPIALVVAALALAWLPYIHTLITRAKSPDPVAKKTSNTPLTAASEPVRPVAVPASHSLVAKAKAPAAPVVTTAPEQKPELDQLALRPERFRATFESEPRDGFWANDHEQKLNELLQAVEFKPEEVADVACRTTVCRITFKQPRVSESRAINLYSRVMTVFGDAHLALHDATSDQPAHLYVLRKDYALSSAK